MPLIIPCLLKPVSLFSFTAFINYYWHFSSVSFISNRPLSYSFLHHSSWQILLGSGDFLLSVRVTFSPPIYLYTCTVYADASRITLFYWRRSPNSPDTALPFLRKRRSSFYSECHLRDFKVKLPHFLSSYTLSHCLWPKLWPLTTWSGPP